MNVLVGTGICSFVLASLWTYLSVAAPVLNLVAWVGFTGWACHFAAGGGATGLQKALASNVAGRPGVARRCWVCSSASSRCLWSCRRICRGFPSFREHSSVLAPGSGPQPDAMARP
jgi:Protein of unknown function (DUF1097)